MELDGLSSLAIEAARAGSYEALSLLEGHMSLEHKEGRYFTRADLASERAILEVLERGPMDVRYISEEGGGQRPTAGEPCWIVDPLDGTWNYAQGGSWWSVSIALLVEGRVVLGVVLSPMLGRTYMVHEGMERPVCNGIGILPDPSKFPGEWKVSFGAPSSLTERVGHIERMLFSDIPTSDPARPVRPSRFLPGRGSMALELCALADGGLNAVFRLGQRCWDVAAGALIAQKAGCSLLAAEGRPWSEEVRRFSRDGTVDVMGATSPDNLGLLRAMSEGAVGHWPVSDHCPPRRMGAR